jgi:hypothetical protein
MNHQSRTIDPGGALGRLSRLPSSLQDASLLPFGLGCFDVPPGTGHPRMKDLAGRGYPAEADLGCASVCIEIRLAVCGL